MEIFNICYINRVATRNKSNLVNSTSEDTKNTNGLFLNYCDLLEKHYSLITDDHYITVDYVK